MATGTAPGGDTGATCEVAGEGDFQGPSPKLPLAMLTLKDDEKDPCVVEAHHQAMAAAARLERSDSVDALTQSLVSNIAPRDRVVILVDAPTSKVSVNHALLDMRHRVCSRA